MSFQRPLLGISIVGGLLVSHILTLYFTPAICLYLDRPRLWLLGGLQIWFACPVIAGSRHRKG